MNDKERAKAFVLKKHKHLFRPNKAKQPVIEHLEEVAVLVQRAGGSDNLIAAAWLHDTVEDTETSLDFVRDMFGIDIAEIVDGLTDPPEFAPMPLQERKKRQAERLQTKSNDIKLVKLCDQISNVKSVLIDPPLDWSPEKCLVYVGGARKIADICRGISKDLDDMFDGLYHQSLEKYKGD